MRLIRRRPSPAMVVALIALFVALGGPAQAKRVIDGASIRRGTITTKQIKNGSVAKADLSKAAVRSLTATPASSVRSAQIVDGQVLAPDLGAGSVGQAQLAPGAVTASKLAGDSVGGGSVANGSLQTVDIGSFTGSVNVDFGPFDKDQNRCQKAEAPAASTGGSPNIADDVVVVSPPSGWSDFLIVTGKPAPGNVIRIVACWSAPTGHDRARPAADDLPLRHLRRAVGIARPVLTGSIRSSQEDLSKGRHDPLMPQSPEPPVKQRVRLVRRRITAAVLATFIAAWLAVAALGKGGATSSAATSGATGTGTSSQSDEGSGYGNPQSDDGRRRHPRAATARRTPLRAATDSRATARPRAPTATAAPTPARARAAIRVVP